MNARGIGTFGLRAEGSSSGADKVTLGELEDQLRSLTGSATAAFARSKTTAGASAALAGVALLAATYLHGRRRGRRRASVLEIRRV